MTQNISFKEDLVRQLAEILNDTNLTEIEYEFDKCRIRVAREVQVNHMLPPPTAPLSHPGPHGVASLPLQEGGGRSSEGTSPEPQAMAPHPGTVKAPMVGTAYLSPSPGVDNFVKVGDSVEEGQTLLIIEAMKVMNQIKAPSKGVVREILVFDTDPVEFDQPLIVIE